MRPSEKLILMLELNNYNIDNLYLKKQIESEKSGNLDFHNCNKYSDLIICNYLFDEDVDYSKRNPLSYKVGSWEEVDSLDQLVIKHPNVGKELTIKEFLSIEIFSDTEKKGILNDVVQTWLDEYREARSQSLKNLQELFFNTTEVNKKHRIPSRVLFVIGVLIAIFNTVLFIRPQTLQLGFLTTFSNFVDSWSQLLTDTPIYIGFGVFVTLLFILYSLQYFAVLYRIKGVIKEQKSNVIKNIYKWDDNQSKAMSKQSKLLKKYVVLVLKKPEKSRLELKKLIGTETLLDKCRGYVMKVEKKYYWVNKNYLKKMKYLRITYFSFILFNLAFIGLAFIIIRGLINV